MADITLDGTTYPWKHGSYQVKNTRLGESKPTASGAHSRSDKGAWKKQLAIILLCENNGVSNGGKTKRASFRTSYNKNTAVTFASPDGDNYTVYFDGDATESLRFDVDTDGNGYEYEIAVSLIES